MKLSTRSRYGLRFLTYLGSHFGEGPIQLHQIAEHENISIKYLEQIVRILKPTGIIKVARGARGGYMLADDPSKVNIYDVVTVLEGNLQLMPCLTSPNACERLKVCPTYELWKGFYESIKTYFIKFQLDQLVHDCKMKSVDLMYHI